MDSIRWLRYFEANRRGRPEPSWHIPCPLESATAAQLARSLSHFQLGESGEGTVLLADAERAHPDDPDYLATLALFVAEEQEHARLLGQLVARLGGKLVSRHWTHGCFRLLRHALGVHFELQTLVVAEVIGLAYYRLLGGRTGDPVLDEVCDLMVRDELPHLEFHRQRLAEQARRRRWLTRCLWTVQFRLFVTASTHAAWFDHGSALRTLGLRREEFLTEARSLRRQFDGSEKDLLTLSQPR